MLANILDIRSYPFSKNEAFLIDANIWLYIHYPQYSKDWRCKVYSNAFGKMLNSKCNILLDALVISEFINRYSRSEHKLAHNNDPQNIPKDFKLFRQSPQFVNVAKSVANVTRRILARCHRTNGCFDSINMISLLNEYESGLLDFNDQILAEICISNGLKLITHDGDFGNSYITVITANNKLLQESF
jgi:predicted nucleic acid-binding protein